MKKNRVKVIELLLSEKWAIIPEYLDKIVAIAQGDGDVEAALTLKGLRETESSRNKIPAGTAMIEVFGPIVPRAGLMTEYSGATSFSVLGQALSEAMSDPNITTIVFNFDSPGGTVTGCEEFASALVEAGMTKRTIAYVSGQAASAAYWLASCCNEIYGVETSMYGSIGTVITLYDDKEALAKEGIRKYDIVSAASPHKRPDISTKEGRNHYQSIVDAMADVFVSAVAENRGVSTDTVLKEFGGGAMYLGQEAVKRGMADGITTLEKLLTYGADMTIKNPASAAAETPAPVATAPAVVAPAAPAPIPPAALVAVDFTQTPEFAAAVAAASGQAATAERTRISECESLKALFPGYEGSVDKHKSTPGMTKGALMEILVNERATKEKGVKGNRDDDTALLNAAAATIGNTGDLPGEGEEEKMMALMLEGASGHESRQYTDLAMGKIEGAKLKQS